MRKELSEDMITIHKLYDGKLYFKYNNENGAFAIRSYINNRKSVPEDELFCDFEEVMKEFVEKFNCKTRMLSGSSYTIVFEDMDEIIRAKELLEAYIVGWRMRAI